MWHLTHYLGSFPATTSLSTMRFQGDVIILFCGAGISAFPFWNCNDKPCNWNAKELIDSSWNNGKLRISNYKFSFIPITCKFKGLIRMMLNMQLKLINDYQTKVLSVLNSGVFSNYFPLVLQCYQARGLSYTPIVLT